MDRLTDAEFAAWIAGAFYDLRPAVPLSASENAALWHETQIDRERRSAERAHRRGDERALRRALSRLHAREERPLR